MTLKTKKARDFFQPVQDLDSAIEVLGGSLNLADFGDSVPDGRKQEFLDFFNRLNPTLFAVNQALAPAGNRQDMPPGYDEEAVAKRRRDIQRIVEDSGDPIEEVDIRHGMFVTYESMYNFYVALRYLDEHLATNWQQLLALPASEQSRLNTYIDFSLEEIKRISDKIKA